MSAGTMRAHPADLEARAAFDPQAFMAGVNLFDDMLREAERISFADKDCYSVYIDASCRIDHEQADTSPHPLSLYVLPQLLRLTEQPQLLPGFAAALGDYLGWLHTGIAPGNGAQFEGLQFDGVWIPPGAEANATPACKLPSGSGWRVIEDRRVT